MAIDSKNLLVWVKAMSRGQALPLDASEIHGSLAEAQNYAASAIAYPGQTIKALRDDGKYHQYMIQPSDSGYVLEEVGGTASSTPADSKQYVMVVDVLPEVGQVEGVLYINGTDGYIWNGSAWVKVFTDISADVTAVSDRVTTLETEMPNKAPLENPVFTGTVKVGTEEVALKSYVDGLFANLSSAEPGIVNSENPLPATDYKAGQTFRVAEAGNYAGQTCEVGDLILVIQNYSSDSASDADFMVLQANVEGAVTSASETSTVGEIVVMDAVTGKVIKGSGVQIASLKDAISKAHTHANKAALDTYDKTQTELLETAQSAAQSLVTTLEESVNTSLDGKADKATTLEGYGITDAYNKTEMDGKLQVITDNLNSKISSAEADTKISEALTERIGEIPDGTSVKEYVDNAIGSGGTSSAEAIATAKREAIEASKAYTDEQIALALTVTEF